MAIQLREISHEERIAVFQQAVNQVRTAAHLLADHEIWAALDETKRCLFHLDRQLAALKQAPADVDALDLNLQLQRKRNGRRRGVELIPGRVKQAREEAGLSLRALGGNQVTGAAICLIEKGRSRPSEMTLALIVSRTGKPREFFVEVPA